MIERTCLECGAPFTVQFASRRKAFCSRSCASVTVVVLLFVAAYRKVMKP